MSVKRTRAEHQPASPTEEILVDELAQHYWRIKRYRYLETHIWAEQGRGEDGKLDADVSRVVWMIDHGMAALFHRTLTSAERSFHKTLKTLQETKKARGFVSQSSALSASAVRPARDEAAVLSEPKTQTRFVPQKSSATATNRHRNVRRRTGQPRSKRVRAPQVARNRSLM